MTQFFSDPRKRLQEPPATLQDNLAKLREMCTTWGRDPEEFTKRYLGLTARSPFFRDHPDKALAHFADKYLCANPMDRRTKDAAEVAPDADEIDIRLPMLEALRAAQRKQNADMAKTGAPERPLTATAQPIVLAPCSVLELKAAFIAQRGARRMTHSDIAGMVGLSKGAISKAENPKTAPWATFFQSEKIIAVYTDSDSTAARALEKKAHAAFYPQGITSLAELVTCVAYRKGNAIDKMGTNIGIKYLSQKINPKGTCVLSIDEHMALRRHLSAEIHPLQHLGLTTQLVDELLPPPQVVKIECENFAAILDRWAVIASGGKGAFVSDVAAHQGRTLAHNSIHYWGAGRGLAVNLEAMIAVLKSKPNTKDIFPDHEQAFREAAQAVIQKPVRTNDTPAQRHLTRVKKHEQVAASSLSR